MARGAVLRTFNEPLTLEEAPVLDPEPGALIARVDMGGVCGTDVHLHHGNLPIPTPVILGHEAVGRVEKLGAGVTTDFNGEPLQEGDAIAWASNIPCGHCYWCVVEKERTLCENRKVYGINQRFDQGPRLSGGWAEFIYLQPGSAVFKLPAGISAEQAIALGCAGPTADPRAIARGRAKPLRVSCPIMLPYSLHAARPKRSRRDARSRPSSTPTGSSPAWRPTRARETC